MSQAAPRRPYVPETTTVARTFLRELRGAHHALAAELANMEAVTRMPEFDSLRCMSGRRRISQASLARRVLAARIHDYFMSRGGSDVVAQIKGLQREDQLLLKASASHVGTWNAKSVSQDWAGYCAASDRLRAIISGHMAEEQRVLYPLLERAAACD